MWILSNFSGRKYLAIETRTCSKMLMYRLLVTVHPDLPEMRGFKVGKNVFCETHN